MIVTVEGGSYHVLARGDHFEVTHLTEDGKTLYGETFACKKLTIEIGQPWSMVAASGKLITSPVLGVIS